MFQSLLAEFSAAWKLFVHLPLPSFLTGDGEESDYPQIDGHPALLRLMLPLVGFVLGFLAAVPAWLLHLLSSGRLIAGIYGLAVLPLVLELGSSWSGLTSLADFLERRHRGEPVAEALESEAGSIDSARSGRSMILLMILFFLRMLFFGLLAAFAPFWLMIALTGAWLVRAELASLPQSGSSHGWLRVPRGLEKHHWYLAAGAMAAGGFLYPLGILLAFTVSWALAVLLRNLCLESISCINPKAFNALGYASELVLLFLGILFYAGF